METSLLLTSMTDTMALALIVSVSADALTFPWHLGIYHDFEKKLKAQVQNLKKIC